MVTTRTQRGSKLAAVAGVKEQEPSVISVSTVMVDRATDLDRWRLLDERGRQTWHYMKTDEQARSWPQSTADRHHLGLPLNLPDLPTPKTPLDAARNGFRHFSNFQLPPGNWACEYGGPMFLLPGLVVTWYVTNTPVAPEISTEIKRYLFARQNPADGGWGLHIEGDSTVYGTAMNYVTLRLLGAGADDPRVARARALLQGEMGGAVNGPLWAKFWLSVLGVMEWEAMNPAPPELWLLPDWVPFAPWRWWIHLRQVFLPISYISSKRFVHPLDDLTRELRKELYSEPYESVNFGAHRNSIGPKDNYHPKSGLLNTLNWALVNIWQPFMRTEMIRSKAEAWAFELIRHEDENTVYANLGPVNGPMNLLACYIHDGPDSESVARHRDRVHDFLWMKNEGMLMNGTNGVQTWDTAFAIQAAVAAGLATDPAFRPVMTKALEFLEDQQMIANCVEQEKCYRHRRKGAWGFSTRDQGYTVSDCTSEALKSVLLLQDMPAKDGGSKPYPNVISEERLRDAVDTLLSMQNGSGGFSSYETQRGSEYNELLNAAEVFGRIMVEYDYPECTTAVVTALRAFQAHDPAYRRADIDATVARAAAYVRAAQRADGSWYGSWGICFTYAAMFALESLASVGERCATSERARRGCAFLLAHQAADGGWGESYRACESGAWVDHPDGSQVVNTCWALIALMEAGCQDVEAIKRGVRLVVGRQQKDGGWAQEGIEGVFNKSCMISYPNYKFYFPVKMLGMFAEHYGNEF